MISDADKKQILGSFVKNIASISDEEYQKRVWVLAEGPECDDIDDTICDFFDEDYVLEKYKEFGITERQHKALIMLHRKLRKFADVFGVYSPEKFTGELIQLPEWQEIINLAKDVLKEFDYRKRISNEFLKSAAHISHREYEEKIWAFGEESEEDGLDKTISYLIDASASIIENYKDYEITNDQWNLLKNFHDQLKAYSNASPLLRGAHEWGEIRKTAKEMLKAFNYEEKPL
jgi:hypothetical protein